MKKRMTIIVLAAAFITAGMVANSEKEQVFKDDADITLEEAFQHVEMYRLEAPPGERLGGMFSAAALRAVLEQEDCIGVRYYHGRDALDQKVMVVVGVDPDNRDMIEGKILQRSMPCPPICPDQINNLNL